MAMKYLGETLDIHCGAIDLIFPHHEDEIAQSEGATGKQFSRFWCHGEFLLTDGSKMAKRVGNVATVQDLREQGIPAAAFRHFVFSTHYRKQLNMSGDALEASMEGVRRVGDFAQRLAEAKAATTELEQIAEDASSEFTAALFDDLNAPIALGALFTFIRKANAELDRGGVDRVALERAREVFARMNSVLDVIPELSGEDPALAQWVEERLAARKGARARREFAEADAIRTEIEARGIAIEDGPQGTKWKKLF
jgi:cysteinyl-tRNA synthetase